MFNRYRILESTDTADSAEDLPTHFPSVFYISLSVFVFSLNFLHESQILLHDQMKKID